MDIESHPFDLRECVESALDLVSTRATEKHLDIAYVFEGDVPAAISTDLTRLRQILLNLLANAVKFTERGEVVRDACAASRAAAGRVGAHASRCATPASASAPRACRACSSRSRRPTRARRASTAAPASAWRSAGAWPS